MKYVCEICGWIYDEELGDAELNIESRTKFKDLPENFECPLCCANKETFTESDE